MAAYPSHLRYNSVMLIALTDAAKIAGITSDSLARALRKKGITVVQFNARANAVDEADFSQWLASRSTYSGKGRPRKPRP